MIASFPKLHILYSTLGGFCSQTNPPLNAYNINTNININSQDCGKTVNQWLY